MMSDSSNGWRSCLTSLDEGDSQLPEPLWAYVKAHVGRAEPKPGPPPGLQAQAIESQRGFRSTACQTRDANDIPLLQLAKSGDHLCPVWWRFIVEEMTQEELSYLTKPHDSVIWNENEVFQMTILVKFHRQKENFQGELTREPPLA